MDVKEEQPSKQKIPRLVTEDGIVMDVKEEQLAKHQLRKLVTVKDAPLYVKLAGITTFREFGPCKSTAVFVSVSNS